MIPFDVAVADVSITPGPVRPKHIPDFTRVAHSDRNPDHAWQRTSSRHFDAVDICK
jgi:hypothetical protein